jgi:hypothetical protein
MTMTKNEFLIYLNAYLEPLELLNTIPNCMKDFGFNELQLIDNDIDISLKKFLETPNWTFDLIKLDENWAEIILKNSSWAFNAIITEIHGFPFYIGEDKFEQTVKRYNLNYIQKAFFDKLANFMKLFESFEVYEVNISNQYDNTGYFAHGEYNVLFKTSKNELFLLFFRDSD